MKKLMDLPYRIGSKPESAKQVVDTGRNEEVRQKYHQKIMERMNKAQKSSISDKDGYKE